MKQGGYGGRAKYILKDALRFIPLYGWYLGMVSETSPILSWWYKYHSFKTESIIVNIIKLSESYKMHFFLLQSRVIAVHYTLSLLIPHAAWRYLCEEE